MQPSSELDTVDDTTILLVVRYVDTYVREHKRCPRAADVIVDVPGASPGLLVAMARVGFVILFGAQSWEDRVCGLLRNGVRLLPDAEEQLALVVRALAHLKSRYRASRRTYVVKPADLAVALDVGEEEATRALSLLLAWPNAFSNMWNDPTTGLVPLAEIDLGILGLEVNPTAVERLSPWEVDLLPAPDAPPLPVPTVDELIEEQAADLSRMWNAGEFSRQPRQMAAAALAAMLQRRGLRYAQRTLYSKLSSYITRHPELFVGTGKG